MFLSFKVNGKKGTLNFFIFFFADRQMVGQNNVYTQCFVLFLHNTAFCKRKLHQITAELIFLWIIIISSITVQLRRKSVKKHTLPPSGRYTMPSEKV